VQVQPAEYVIDDHNPGVLRAPRPDDYSDGYTRAILQAQEDVDTLGADLEDARRATREFRETLRDFLGSFGGVVAADGAALLERYDALFRVPAS
jgi:hypothetical protein